MGYTGKLQDKLHAQRLRKKGYSYKEILQKIKVSKDTLSRWCRDIQLSDDQKVRLISNRINGQKKGSIIAADNKRKIRIERTNEIYKEAAVQVGTLNDREAFIAGIALYAAEGDKNDKRSGFTNSDPGMIEFMMHWFRTYCKIPEAKFRGAIWLHEGSDEGAAKEYWSRVTGIPQDQFFKTYIAKNKTDSRKIRKKIHSYGIFSIRCSDCAIQRLIMGWISALFSGKISDAFTTRVVNVYSPVAQR